jgi:Spy/CpxP family protein refolding chaperone
MTAESLRSCFTKLYMMEKRATSGRRMLPAVDDLHPRRNKETSMSDPSNTPGQHPNPLLQPKRYRSRRALWIATLAIGVAAAAAFATSAFSFGPGHWHRGAMFAPFDPARAEERADRAVRHLAIEVDATSEQQERLRAIVKETVRDLMPMRDQAHAARMRARDLLTAPALDRAALERFRTEQVALAEAVSKRLVQAVGDAAEVLTPEQRRKIGDHLPPARGYGPPWRRW